MKSKYILIGNKGQLGKEFEKLLRQNGESFLPLDLPEFDINSFKDLYQIFLKIKPKFVINCAAFTNVESAEVSQDAAFMTNAISVRNLAQLCNIFDSKLIHFSTDYVFDGKKSTPYTEIETTNPLNFYGKSKLLGEIEIENSMSNYLIYRSSWIYGNGTQNFIYKLLNWSKANQTLNIVDDEISVPTSAKMIAEVVINSIEQNFTGLYHLTNSGACSRYQFAKEIAKIMQLNVEIKPAKMYDFPSSVKRPSYSVMSSKKFMNDFKIELPEWQKSLREFLENEKLN